MCSWCMWEMFIGICKLCFRDMAKFCGYVHGYICGDGQICGYEILTCEKFCWVCDVDSWKICMVMILAVRTYLCMSL